MRNHWVQCLCILAATVSAASGATTTSISQFGVTWTFDQPVEYGQFANGDFWVVGPVTITDINPGSTDVGGYVVNGSMINPVPQSQQHGFDSRITTIPYVPELNVAYGVSAGAPLTVPTHSSLLSSISLPERIGSVTIDTVAILTVVPEAPPAGSFRPAYCGDDKSIRHNSSELDYNLLLNLAPQGSPPAMAAVEAMFERPWIEYVADWPSRVIHPLQNMPDYGREISSNISQASLMLHLDIPAAQKETLLIRFVQTGLDLYGVVAAGGTNVFVANGGHMHGRKWPILFSGLMLGDVAMQNVEAAFQEDQQTYYGVGWTGAKALWRITPGSAYLQDEVHPSNWVVDGRGLPGDPPAGSSSHMRSESYRHCCTSYTWVAQALAAYLMGAEGLWGHSEYFGYVERWMTEDYAPFHAIAMAETGRTYTNFQGSANPGWSRDMWLAYRSLGGPVPPTADAGVDLTVRDNDDNGVEDVALDGSGSVALGAIVTYEWTAAGTPIATGATPTVTLAVGIHTIDLTVTDENGVSHSDSVAVTVDPSPAGGGTLLFDLSAAYNYDATCTQSEADNRTSGENIVQSYGDHQTWTNNRTFAATEAGRDGMPEHGWVVTTYGDYRVSTEYAEPEPTPGSNSPNSIYLYRAAGGSTPGAVTVDINLAPADQGRYATVNALGVGTSTDSSAEQAKFTLEARYQDGAREAIYVSGLNGADAQTGLPSPVASSVTGLGPQSAYAMADWCANNTGGQVLFAAVGTDNTVNLWELGGDDGLAVDSEKILVGFTMTLERTRTSVYPFGSKAVLFAISGKPADNADQPGDADGDGDVDLDDFVILKITFGASPLLDDRADFDNDGDVDLDDFVILKTNFGS